MQKETKKAIIIVAVSLIGILLFAYLRMSCARNSRSEGYEEYQEVYDIKKFLKVEELKTSKPNIVDGIDLKVKVKNLDKRTVKYVTLYLNGVNAVNDVVKDKLSGKKTKALKITGPIKSGESKTEKDDAFWYNKDVKKAKVVSATIEYMNGDEIEVE